MRGKGVSNLKWQNDKHLAVWNGIISSIFQHYEKERNHIPIWLIHSAEF